MNKPSSAPVRLDLRQQMIEDMIVRGFSAKTQHDYLRVVSRFAAFLGRSPITATAEEVRRFQVEQREAGMPAPAMNSHVAALRASFTTPLAPGGRVPRPRATHPLPAAPGRSSGGLGCPRRR